MQMNLPPVTNVTNLPSHQKPKLMHDTPSLVGVIKDPRD